MLLLLGRINAATKAGNDAEVTRLTRVRDKGALPTQKKHDRRVPIGKNERTELLRHADEAGRMTLSRVSKFENSIWRNILETEIDPEGVVGPPLRKIGEEGTVRFAIPHEELFSKLLSSPRGADGVRIFRSVMDVVGEQPQIRRMLIKELDQEFKKPCA